MSGYIRTVRPTKSDKYYIRKASGGYSTCIQGKPTDSQCNVLANCVGFACGFLNEYVGLGYEKYHLNCNAENFVERAIASGLSVVKNPVPGGVLVWQKGATLSGSDGAGHVAGCTWVDNVDNPTKIKTSESGYGSSAFWTSTRTNSNGKWGASSGYSYRGCIVPPNYKKPEPEPTPTPEPTPAPSKSIDELAQEVIAGKWGNNPERKQRLTDAGYDYAKVQARVNEILAGNKSDDTNFKVGDIVVPTRLVNYTGTKLRQYDKNYTITELKGDRAVLSANRKGKMIVWAAMNTKDIKKA